MTKIDGEYLVTDEASVAVLFWGKAIDCQSKLLDGTWEKWDAKAWSTWSWVMVHVVAGKARIRIPRALVREAIEPVEGEAAICEYGGYDNDMGLILLSADEVVDPTYESDEKFNWRMVNICQSYGELRKLVEWARGK